MLDVFNKTESEVQSYGRIFPRIFNKAKNECVYDENGVEFIDFLAGAGTLNYGHNNPIIKEKLIEYLNEDGITHSLDLYTSAKREFLDVFDKKILKPRKYEYVVQFTGPTGANAVEAALKLARKITDRENVISFTNGFHGVTLGALAVTGNHHHRGAAGICLNGVTRMPYDGYLGEGVDTTKYLDKVLSDYSSGVDKPAAVIVETVQGEGGVNTASFEWLRNLEEVCRKHSVLLIIDDIQAGCGRTGTFFSFEEAGIRPDMITMSKAIGGYGLPFAVVLIRPEHDKWKPGEHNGTFRGNNLAFIAAKVAIDHYWNDDSFAKEINYKSEYLSARVQNIVGKHAENNLSARGRGMFQGINCVSGALASQVSKIGFREGLIIETSGDQGQVVKFLCPLTISKEKLSTGLDIVERSFVEACAGVNSVHKEKKYL